VTSLDHDANVRPWVQAAQAMGAQVRWAHFDPETAELPVDAVTAVLSPRTRLVALTGASNVLGTKPDVAALASLAHQQGALVFLDAVHLAPHASIDMATLGVDFIACSPYKFFGPHLGVLAGVPQALESLRPAKLLPSPARIPERFEMGTLPYEALAGVSAAVDFIAELSGASTGTRRERLGQSYSAVEAHEHELQARLEEGLDQLPSVVRYSRASHRTPTVYLRVAGVDGAEVSQGCAQVGVNAPYSNFYAIEASRRLGLGDDGAIRAGIAAYTTTEDVDRLVAAVRSAGELRQ
ncbi:MAG: aminotransferase class V-fold PLP-dependent enzyme, partial [Ornithinimicrobium sp.]